MSTSVIGAARQSTTSVFSVVTRSADAVINLLDAAALSADILTHKARVLNHGAVITAKLDMAVQQDELIVQAATRYTDVMEETHKRNFPGVQFDRPSVFNAALETMKAAAAA